jgi:hypothetical protein
MANSVKLSFNETTYEFVLNKVIETGTDEVRRRYTILINGEADSKLLLVSTMGDKPLACYSVLQPYAGALDGNGIYAYNTPYKQYYEKDFPMDIVFSIVTFLNK